MNIKVAAFTVSEKSSNTDDNFFFVTEFCTQSRKLKEDIMVAFDRENMCWDMVYNFLGIDEKT